MDIKQTLSNDEAKLAADAKAELARIDAFGKDQESVIAVFFDQHKALVLGVIAGVFSVGCVVGHFL